MKLQDLVKNKNISNSQKENLTILLDNIINPLLNEWVKLKNDPFIITTCLGDDKKYHKSSPHLTGEAVDISTNDIIKNKELFELARSLNLPYNYIISENNYRDIHISIGLRRKQKQVKIPYQILNIIC